MCSRFPHPAGPLAYRFRHVLKPPAVLYPLGYCVIDCDDQGVPTPRVSCAQSSSSQGPDIRGAHPEVSGTASVYRGSRDGGQGQTHDNGPQCLAVPSCSQDSFVIGDSRNQMSGSSNDALQYQYFGCIPSFSTQRLTPSSSRDFRERVPVLRDVDNLRTDHRLPGSRQIGKPSCVPPRSPNTQPPSEVRPVITSLLFSSPPFPDHSLTTSLAHAD